MYVFCVRQRSCPQSSLKQNITNVIVCEMFHFFWILPTENFLNVSVKYTELQRFPVFTAFFSRIFVTIIIIIVIIIIVIIIIIFVFSSPFRCYLHMLQNVKTILLHWNIEFARRSIPCSFFEWLCLWNSGYLCKTILTNGCLNP